MTALDVALACAAMLISGLSVRWARQARRDWQRAAELRRGQP